MAKKIQKYKPDTVRAAFRDRAVGEESPEGEQRMFCPVCEDPRTSASPSASMNADLGKWNCLKGNHGGSIYDLVQDLKRDRNFDIRSAAMKGMHSDPNYKAAATNRLNGGTGATNAAPLPGDETIQRWTESLLNNSRALKLLQEQRGFDRKTIVEYEIGWDGGRYTIPVRSAAGELLNVRRYKLGASAADKMLNLPGHGSAQLFHPEILEENDEVVITEGETDCILLNQYGIPAVTHTAGAATFRPQWASSFSGKTVWICYDNDDAGRKGALKVEAVLKEFASVIFVMDIGVAIPNKGADVTDYLHKEGHSADEFRALMELAQERLAGGRREMSPLAIAGERASLEDSMAQANQAKTMELVVSVAGRQQEPYTAPKRITATCDQSKGTVCEYCPLSGRNGQMEVEVRQDSEDVFRFVDVGETRRRNLLREITGARCTDRVEFEVEENYHVEELLVQPSVDERVDDQTQLPIKRTAFSVATHNTQVNRKVRLVGRNVADPKSGKLKFMTWVNDPVEMDIDKFKLTDELRQRLRVFQPDDHQMPLDKMLEIAGDMADTVTHIYGRDLLHVGYDLVWHSVLAFNIGDVTVQKGWLECAMIGDTRIGKSEVAYRLTEHYRAGKVQSCEGMSFPGLVGGVQQIDGRWHMTWGVVPMHDRRLVVLDEVSGLSQKDVIEQMSSIRSSGIAQITKIATEETSARTRMIWIMNPGDGSSMRDNPGGGMQAIRTVVPASEDIARFDFMMAGAKDEVKSELINRPPEEHVDPIYSSEDCEALVKWAWSLTRNDVHISEMAANRASEEAIKLGHRYISDPPLIQGENVRFKLLRIAAAIAARTFSVSRNGGLSVKVEHVKDAVRFLDMIYEQESMGYARASKRQIASQQRAQEKYSRAVEFLREHQDDVFLTLRMVGGNTFRTRDFVDHGAMDLTQARAVVQTLLKWNLIKLLSRGDIRMEQVLVEAIRELEDDE